ncbi:MAG: cobalamin-dependent protein [Actinomycetota bacterium]
MARILLAHPLFLAESEAEREAASPYFPLGLLSIAAYVRERGHEVEVFDGTFAEGPSAFLPVLAARRPDVVGISAVLPSRPAALELAGMAASAGATVVVGGPDATAAPEAYLAGGDVHVVVHHEGERTITRLLELVDAGPLTAAVLREEPGVAFLDGAELVVTPQRPPIDDLDSLPPPARDLVDLDRYLEAWREQHGYSSLTVSVSRGCPTGCEWCRDAVHGQGFRIRSPEHVAAEVRDLEERYGVDSIRLVDDVDELDRGWVESWAAAAEAADAVVPFEALNDVERRDLPMLEVRDGL